MRVRQCSAAGQQQHPRRRDYRALTAAAAAASRSVVHPCVSPCTAVKLQSPVALAATGSSASGASASTWLRPPLAPWSLTFDLRERETEWTDANKSRLVALVAAQHLSIPMADMEQRLEQLMLLLPDLAGSIFKLQPALLARLTADLAATSSRLLALRELLPAANVSLVVAERPQLLLQDSNEVQQAMQALQQLLHVDRVDKLVEAQPLLLVTACVEEVLADMRRLMPGSNAEQLLAADPDWVLRVQRGEKWLGQHPDSDPGELINWAPPTPQAAASNSGKKEYYGTAGTHCSSSDKLVVAAAQLAP